MNADSQSLMEGDDDLPQLVAMSCGKSLERVMVSRRNELWSLVVTTYGKSLGGSRGVGVCLLIHSVLCSCLGWGRRTFVRFLRKVQIVWTKFCNFVGQKGCFLLADQVKRLY